LLICTLRPAAAAPDPARAEAFEKAQTHIHLGAKLFRKEQYRAALVAFEEALALYPSARIQYLIGRCHQELDEIAPAITAFERLLKADPASPEAEKSLVALAELRARLPGRLDVHCVAEGAQVRLGEAEPLSCPWEGAVPPGEYALQVTAPGRDDWTTRIEVHPGETTRVNARTRSRTRARQQPRPPSPVAAPERPPDALPLALSLGSGAAFAGAALFAVVAVKRAGKADDLYGRYQAALTPDRATGLRLDVEQARGSAEAPVVATWVSLGAGALLAGLATWCFIVGDTDEATSGAGLRPTGSGLELAW